MTTQKKPLQFQDSKKPPAQSTASGVPVHCAYTELVDVVNLVPHPRNPNKHPDKQVALLAKVIRHQGWRSPVVVSKRSGFIVAGHGRLQAAAILNVEKVPVDYQDFATEADEMAHLVADNRIAELAEIDGKELAGLLKDLEGKIDLDVTGFDVEALGDVEGFTMETEADAEPVGINYNPQFGVIVICKDDASQEAAYGALLALGYECKVVVT
jgi:hypothetical protein